MKYITYKGVLFLILLVLSLSKGYGQTDTEFWFAAPFITPDHNPGGGQPLSFQITTLDLPATVTIEMPGNKANFTDIVINIPANSTYTYDVPPGLNGEIMNSYDNLGGTPGRSNKAIHITSSTYINVYYQYGNFNNPDIWALKGRNALGTEFYTSFQTVMKNVDFNNSPAYSAFDIAITEDNTFLTLAIPAGLEVYNGPNPPLTGTVTLGPFNRGDTYSGVPNWVNNPEKETRDGNDFFGRAAIDHLAGVKVTTNGKKIAISIKDDSMKSLVGGCYDLIGDQTISTDIIGNEYIAMRGELTTGNLSSWYNAPPANPVTQEALFILATEDNTDVFINGVYWQTLDNAETGYYTIPTGQDFTHVRSADSAVYVLQITGPANGCEMGGAILPPTGKCTGSTKVGFTRSYDGAFKFYLNIMVRKGAEDGFLLNGIKLSDAISSPINWIDVPGDSNWKSARIGPVDDVDIGALQPMLLVNTKDIFHLGTINGNEAGGARFGYFSDYNELKVEAFIDLTGSGDIRMCYGESAQLVAKGGTEVIWSPTDYLNDPYSFTPVASPISTTQYVATIQGACNMKDSTSILVQVAPPLTADFTIDTTFGCSPLNVRFKDKSKGVKEHKWDFGDGTIVVWNGEDTINNDTTFVRQYQNLSRPHKKFTTKLMVTNSNLCRDTLERFITIFPEINANIGLSDTIGCNPLTVAYSNNTPNASDYLWEFGDGSSSNDSIATHVFQNTTDKDTTYKTTFIASSLSEGYGCADTLERNILVHPYLNASFTIDTVEKCSPLTIRIHNTTTGGKEFYWDLSDSVFSTTNSTDVIERTYYNSTATPDTITIRLRARNEGGAACEQWFERQLIVYPEVNANFIPNQALPIAICDSIFIAFNNASTGFNLQYTWDFGDGGSSAQESPSHVFYNRSDNDQVYPVELTATSIGNRFCTDTYTVPVTVHPYVKADFAMDHASNCTPFPVTLENPSIRGDRYDWDFDNNGVVDTSTFNELPFEHVFTNAHPSNSKIYTVRMRATNFEGCSSTKIKQIEVFPRVTANFSTDVTEGCQPLNVEFTQQSTGGSLTYKWDFKDSTSSTTPDASFQHVFKNTASTDRMYNVTLTATNPNGCESVFSAPITAYAFIEANFTLPSANSCSPFPVTPSNQSLGGITGYSWDFNGFVSAAENPSHTYVNKTLATQVNPLRLIVNNSHNCRDTIIRNVTVYPEVVASFSMDQSQGCNPLPVSFTNTSNQPVAQLYAWDFGNGSASNQVNPSHTFSNLSSTDQTYPVNLTATSAHACRHDTTINVTTYAFIKADFKFDSAFGCSPKRMNITNSSSGGIATYAWDFDDGFVTSTASSAPPVHQYINQTLGTQVRDLQLVVKNNHNCFDTLVRPVTVYPEVVSAFAADVTEGCNPLTVQFTNNSNTPVAHTYQWDFQNGASSGANSPSHTFSHMENTDQVYPVSLRSVSEYGCFHDTTLNIISYAYINADYAVAKAEGCSPKIVNISNASSGGIVSYAWNFGDGAVQNTPSSTPPAHTYTNKSLNVNTHPLRLVVKNNHNCFDTLIRNITVYPEVVSRFSADVTEGCNPLQVQFTSSSNIPVATTYQWDFKDGASSDLRNPAHTFTHLQSTDQVYPVSLRSISNYGCFHDTTLNITSYAHIKADFALGKADGCSPFSIGLRNSSAGGISTYAWDFGDGSQATSRTPTHTYINQTQNVITNPIRLIVKNAHNCFDTIIKNATVYPEVTADFEVDSGGCHPLTLAFSNTSNLGDNFQWSFGDGSTSAAVAPTHLYNNYTANDVTNTVKLVASSNYTCADSITKNITVYHKPNAKFQVDRLIDCPPFNLDIENISQSYQSTYYWDFDDGTYDTLTTKQALNHTFDNLPDNPDNRPYTISLYAETNYGCNDDYELTINVYPRVTANFNFDTAGCSPYDLPFENLSTNADEYYWDFGDNTQSKQEAPYHVFFSTDNYSSQEFDIYLRSTSVEGCTDDTAGHITVHPSPIADFSVTPSLRYFGFDGAEFTIFNDTEEGSWDYEWSYDNGDSAFVKDPTPYNYDHWGSYDITLNAFTDHCSNSISQPIIILPPIPFAHFDSSYSACAPIEMNFRNNSLWGNSYLWEFDDDQISTEQHPTHVFDEAGIYNVKLTVEGDGGKAYHYETVTVYPNPEAKFAIEPQNVMLPDAVVKCYSTSKLADNYYWTFGDGKVAIEEHPEHLYDALGAYDVSLTVWTENGCRDSLFLKEAVLVEGEGFLEFPNAFTPNLSGPADPYYDPSDLNNDVFFPVHEGVKEIHLEVYSRWGELIFTSDDVNKGWNGYFNGKLVPQAVYVYKAKGTFYNGKPFNKAGDITVLHNPMNPGQ